MKGVDINLKLSPEVEPDINTYGEDDPFDPDARPVVHLTTNRYGGEEDEWDSLTIVFPSKAKLIEVLKKWGEWARGSY